ncbi:cysteine hydrolase family protein [Dongia deserti]|uniref:cysteine hydrolase family protein n=1 Tax=Dongia deserti TaxID=2268030 RepID=UPI000E65267A|nr:cysteine hydrolase family protein [Dongia deserti]
MPSANPRTALLLIDIQQGMFGPDEICHEPERLLANASALLERARATRVPVFHVQHCEEGGPLAPSTAAWQIHPQVAPRDGEPVIQKWACSSFYNTDLDQRLRVAGVGRLVIAGLQSDFCIDTACRVAQTLGYAVTLAGDAHSTMDNGVLAAEQIIRHHNRVLSGIVEKVAPAAEIAF